MEAFDSIARTGLELTAWCRARNIDARSLAGWQTVLEARGYEPPPARDDHPEFVEVVRVPVDRSRPYVIRHRNFSVEVDEAFDDAALGRLLKVVAAC